MNMLTTTTTDITTPTDTTTPTDDGRDDREGRHGRHGAGRRARRRWPRVLLIGALVLAGLTAVLVRDIARIDQTRGGYEAPYENVTGEPIDWLSLNVTDTGFRDTGGVFLNSSLDCTTGQIRFHVGPLTIDYRTLSERAVVVHRPQDACRQVGFEPQWDVPAWAQTAGATTATGARR